MRCLLGDAAEHAEPRPVPHLAPLAEYESILQGVSVDEAQAQRVAKRPRKFVDAADEWDVPAAAVAPKQSRSSAQQHRGSSFAPQHEGSSFAPQQGGSSAAVQLGALPEVASASCDEDKALVGANISGSAGSGSVATESDNEVDMADNHKPIAGQPTVARAKSSGRRSSSSGSSKDSSSSSSDGSSSSSSQSSTGKEKKHVRDTTNRVDFGLHHLTPRYKAGTLVSFQMTCCDPRHNTGTHRCSKELSVHLTDGPEGCRQVLKAWVLLSSAYASRSAHMSATLRKTLLEAKRDGHLLSENELDLLKTTSLSQPVEAPFAEAVVPSSSAGGQGGEGRSGSNLLGKRAANVSAETHAQMIELARQGDIPVTTLSQRQRNSLTKGTSYGVPAALKAALTHGYIHPNLIAPRGMVWRCHANKWKLSLRGG